MSTTIRIMLMPDYFRRAQGMVIGEKHVPAIRKGLHFYTVLPPMSVHPSDVGVEVAAEMFDLTNNPERSEERDLRYGNGPSLSPGDVVRTADGDFLCCSFGWQKL